MLKDVLPDETARAEAVFRAHSDAFQEVDRTILLALSLLPGPDSEGLTITCIRDLDRRTVLLVMALLTKLIKKFLGAVGGIEAGQEDQ